MTDNNFRGEAEIKGDTLLIGWGIYKYTLPAKNFGRIRMYTLPNLGLLLNVGENPTIVLYDSDTHKGSLARLVYNLSKICKEMNIEFLLAHNGELNKL